MVEGQAHDFAFIHLYVFTVKYETFRRKQAVLFINLLGKGLTQENSGSHSGLLVEVNDHHQFGFLYIFSIFWPYKYYHYYYYYYYYYYLPYYARVKQQNEI